MWDIHLKIKPWPFYRIMEEFILKVNKGCLMSNFPHADSEPGVLM